MKKDYRDVKLGQKAWLKSDIDMNSVLRKNSKDDFDKDFFKLMNNVVFQKTMENMKLMTTEAKRNCLVSEPNHYPTRFFSENLIPIEIKKALRKKVFNKSFRIIIFL